MLTHIHIKNFIIVKSLSLDFQKGLHVLTGETGAGKSIWIDAIEIGLGGRADAQMIYPSEKTCDITLCFDLQNQPNAKAWLQSNDLPDDNECIIRRIIDQDKPSRTTINGMPVPQQLVRAFSEYILSIHGQHQHQRLLKAEDQRALLDHYAQNEDLLLSIQTDYEAWKSLDRELHALKQKMQNRSSDLTLWQYQLDELEQLHIVENEYDTLFSTFQQLHHTKQFATGIHETYEYINGDENPAAIDLVQQALHHLQHIPSSDEKIENIRSLLKTAAIHLDEAQDALRQYSFNADFNADQLARIENRLALLQDIARKHHSDPNQLTEIENALRHKILLLEKADETLLSLENQKNNIILKYQETAKQLTTRRKKYATQLSTAITKQMQELGMNGGKFKIDLFAHQQSIHFNGNEDIQFLVSTNPGQTPQALSHIVSGGELSRLSLIMQVLSATQKNTPTLIFDEVDVGVGGKTADIIGRLLRELSNQAQVLCVTHLPQVAAFGHHHFCAKKLTDGKTTHNTITLLDTTERAAELARMLSGAQITEKSLSHAHELLMHVTN
ncbi:MAG: DNA repair protein RecN [Gammaproteobacteria bacterium RIFCSPHIGHO2_12_FULL_40_19]|nr:MAG: DNA repair protein RecN [Gammaproteobacteria bacterium RIFCSPHIGHO2_12_FULL_40_19]